MTKKKSDEPTFGGQKAIGEAIDEGRDPNADLETPERRESRAEAALALAVQGAPWRQVARIAGYTSPTQARLAIERVLAESADSSDTRETMRALQDMRLRRLLMSVMPKAVDPGTPTQPNPDHLPYNARALAIIDRMNKMWGLDEALKVSVTPTDSQINELLDIVKAAGGAQQASEEGSIWDGEIVERIEEAKADGEEA